MLTYEQQKLLIFMKNHNNKCTYHTQGTYKSKSRFYTAVNKLVSYSPWTKKKSIGNGVMEYSLTLIDGRYLAEQLEVMINAESKDSIRKD